MLRASSTLTRRARGLVGSSFRSLSSAGPYVGAIDQGTTSSRFCLFDTKGAIVSSHQMEHKQILPQAGWTEHNPNEIVDNIKVCIDETMSKSGISPADVKAIGITNQRETTIVWDTEVSG
jgi:glycerol kinase